MSERESTTPVRWNSIPRFPGFRFGDNAEVQTSWTMGVKPKIGGEWRTIKAGRRPTGYSWIYLGSRKTTSPLRLDELVCEAHHGDRPLGTECLRRDGDRTNCSASNLYWGVADARDPLAEYRRIEQSEGYEYGSDGSVWSAWGTGFDAPGDVWHRMNPTVLDSGHLQVTVKWNGEMRRFGVHHLIATAFHGLCPDGMECCHNDGVPDHNAKDNLRWGTRGDNARDQIAHGVMNCGEKHASAKLTEVIVVECRRRYDAGETTVALAAEFGVSAESMSKAISGDTWAHVSGAVPIRNSHVRKLSDAMIVDLRALYAEGISVVKMAATFGVSVPTMSSAISGKTYADLPGAIPVRDDHGRKLTDEQEEEVCRLAFKEKWTLARIAEEFGICKQTVANILERRS